MSTAALLDAMHFAALKHRDHRRKDVATTPYINHPIAVANFLANTGGINDIQILQAALLHDTIEDTDTTTAEIENRFGAVVAGLVAEVTDDKSLPNAVRKQLQTQEASKNSRGAALIKLADKTCNLHDLTQSPPSDWSFARRDAYFDWAKAVVETSQR